MTTDADIEIDALAKFTGQQIDKGHLLDWLLRQPAVKAQSYFWNYSSRTERRKAMLADMRKDVK